MLTVEKSIIIHKPVEEVFAFVTAGGNYTKFQPGVTEVIDHGPRNTVGSTYTEVRQFMGQELRTTMEITAFEPNVRWAGKVVKGPVFYEMTVTYEASNGGTKYTTKLVGDPKGFFKLAEGMVAKQLEKTMTESLQMLKDQLEKS